MKLYLAPLEGITSYIYRKALYQCFDGFDKYFIPFIRAKQNLNFSGREKKDISPENNSGMYAVPQILTRNADDFLRTANQLKEYGYQEVNLNLGCPSKTVVTKGCGAGFLARPEELKQFLDRIFSKTDMKISVKHRLGMEDAEEFPRLMEIYNRFPMEELIIHPRVQKDYYKNTPNLDMFAEAVSRCNMPLCYNGDICSVEDYERIRQRFPEVTRIMIGRGLMAHPELALQIREREAARTQEKAVDPQEQTAGIPLDNGAESGQGSVSGASRMSELSERERLDRIGAYANALCEAYCEAYGPGQPVLFKMKELWGFLADSMPDGKKLRKKVHKVQRLDGYRHLMREVFPDIYS